MHKFVMVALLAATSIAASAQQVTTLYFLENAPMRHTINPAFQPVSQGFINFSPIGWTSMSWGNNSLTMSDLVYVDPKTGKTITAIHPNADKNAFLRTMRNMTLVNGGLTFSFLNFGFRLKDAGYVTIGINERLDVGTSLPKSMFEFMLAGKLDLTNGTNTFGLSGLGIGATAYTEVAGGYSHRINDQWTVGGKVKFLLGQMNAAFDAKNLNIKASNQAWKLQGGLGLNIAGPINMDELNIHDGSTVNDLINAISGGEGEEGTKKIDWNKVVDFNNVPRLLTPSGYGGAIDVGFTYKPIENLQISLALNDLGFVYWMGNRYSVSVDTTFNGVGNINYNDPAFHDEQGNFSTQMVMDSVVRGLQGLTKAMLLTRSSNGGYARMISTRLNLGVDANFWDNRVGVGVVSATRLYNARLYEEVTLGVAFRPVNWFNIAASYSLLENGKFSNIGAGLSIMPYDGINLTVAMDYIPTSYAALDKNAEKPMYVIPYKAKNINLAFGLSICWGTNRRDRDKDGVWDKLDMCPDTPRGVEVDSVGCPLDEDHDGVPDYLDHCLHTPSAAIGHVDSLGCPKDSDGDGVPDYLDKCPNTPTEAIGYVDSVGCPKDSDGDGVPDYLDRCPNTPEEARNKVDTVGCPKDSDGDGVPDYLDQCPETPMDVKVDTMGCPIDSDGDGVPDYKDECPDTPKEAIGFVDEKGCIKDSDGDGIPDYEDECPYVMGIKANKGCPEVKKEVRKLLQKAMQGVEFETGKATIKSKSYDLLNLIATIFIDNPNYIVEIQGHTDNTGKAETNKKISQKRAEAVRNYLIKQGVPAERLTAVGYGSEVPIADNKTAKGRQKNRRVEFKISFEEVHYETILDHADPTPAPADSTTNVVAE